MKKLNDAVDRFAYHHPNFGIPNLMKFIVAGNVIVFLLLRLSNYSLYGYLGFNWGQVLHLQLWRLVSFIFVPDVRKAVEEKASIIKAYVVGDELKEIELKLGDLTDVEREIILKGCLINYYRG